MKKDQKIVIGNLKDKIFNVPTAPMQEVVPVKKEEIKIDDVGFHIMIPKKLHIELKVRSTQEGMTMKEWVIGMLEKKLRGKA